MFGCIIAFITDIVYVYMCCIPIHMYNLYIILKFVHVSNCQIRHNILHIYNLYAEQVAHNILYTMIIIVLQVAMSYSKDFKHCGQLAWSIWHINVQQ